MFRQRRFHHLIWLFVTFAALPGCALFGGSPEAPTKNPSIHFKPPEQPFEREHITSADAVWQSTKTGSTIAVNSACRPGQERSLHGLQEALFSGIEKIQIHDENEKLIGGLPSLRTSADGWYDGARVNIESLVIKKADCVYDLIFIAAPSDFEKERDIFNRFIANFKLP